MARLHRWAAATVSLLLCLAGCSAEQRREAVGAEQTAAEVDTLIIGVIEGIDQQVFGRIRDLEVGREGEILVLDQQTLRLSLFDRYGGYLGVAGGSGGGPGEFRAPVGIAVDADGAFHVLDAAYRRVSVLKRGRDGLELSHEVTVPVYGNDFCVTDDAYYILAADGRGIIHHVSEEGSRLHSFGDVPEPIDPALRSHAALLLDAMTRGRLACVPTMGLILYLPEALPYASAYREDGELLWRITLPDYHKRRWTLTDRGGIRLDADPESGTAHTGVSLAVIDDERLAITLHEGSLSDPEGRYEQRVIEIASGKELQRAPASVILMATRNGLSYGYVNLPFPRILVYPR